MKNKNLFLLSFFSLLPTATQCMEPIKEIVVKPRTMQDIRNDRDAIYRILLNREKLQQLCPQHPINVPYGNIFIGRVLFQNKNDLSKDSSLINFHCEGYSLLNLATMRIQRPVFIYETNTHDAHHNDLLIQNPIQVPFKEKKEAIQQLLSLTIKKTEKDTYIALLAKYEEFEPLIIKKICTFQHAPLLTEINMPTEINPRIALFMFNLEESLL